jgi:hypothetical protein
VIALAAGGVRESVRAGVTGVYYEGGDDAAALARAVEGFDPLSVDPDACVASARQFGSDRFRDQLRRIVAQAVEAERAPRPGERPAVVTGLLPRRTTRRAAAG